MRLFNWALGRGEIDRHPFEGLPAPAPKKVRDRKLENEEIADLWQGTLEIEGPVGPLYRMLILTGQRLSEVTGMTWSEINLENRVWRIPGRRTKNALEHEVPLSTLAMAELQAIRRGPQGGFVFSSTGGRSPLNSPNKMKKRMDERSGVRDWRNHDLRRTVRSGLAALGVVEIVSERVLNHAERDQLVRAYNRHQYLDEKRDALERWAQRVRDIVTLPPENVTRLRAAQ
jgi:integrase